MMSRNITSPLSLAYQNSFCTIVSWCQAQLFSYKRSTSVTGIATLLIGTVLQSQPAKASQAPVNNQSHLSRVHMKHYYLYYYYYYFYYSYYHNYLKCIALKVPQLRQAHSPGGTLTQALQQPYGGYCLTRQCSKEYIKLM